MTARRARTVHLVLWLLGLALYIFFVIPRWWVLMGDIPATLGTVGRILAGAPIAAAAVPVGLVLRGSLRDESTQDAVVPEIALRLRAWSAVLHVVAGVLIVLTAIAEIWLHSPTAAPWLYAFYGAAGSIAILAALAWWLSLRAEKPPAPLKPARVKKVKAPKRKKARAEKLVEPAESVPEDEDAADTAGAEESSGLRNKRPTGKSRLRSGA